MDDIVLDQVVGKVAVTALITIPVKLNAVVGIAVAFVAPDHAVIVSDPAV